MSQLGQSGMVWDFMMIDWNSDMSLKFLFTIFGMWLRHWGMKLLDKEGMPHRLCLQRVQLVSTTFRFRDKGNILRKIQLVHCRTCLVSFNTEILHRRWTGATGLELRSLYGGCWLGNILFFVVLLSPSSQVWSSNSANCYTLRICFCNPF